MAELKSTQVPVATPVAEKPVVVNTVPKVQPKPVVLKKTVAPRRVGAFRGAFTGFLLGVTVTGAGAYYYLLDEYRKSNNVILADILALQSSIAKLEDQQNK